MFDKDGAKTIRAAAVAGAFYPEDREVLFRQVQDYLDSVTVGAESPPKAIIAPHAGYIYSGAVAASVYKRIESMRGKIERVVMIGPSHRVPFSGLALSSTDFYDTPLGRIPLDKAGQAAIRDMPGVVRLDEAHAFEHSLEVQLPFLQVVLGDFQLLPIVAGDAAPSLVGQVLERLWGGEETLIVISSDLSHYHVYQMAQRIDRATSESISKLRYSDIGPNEACGCIGINGLLWLARKRGLHAEIVDLRNSGDTAGDRSRVVGYGAYVIH